jgi:two-component system chemotaxis sensor kinase CheA
MSMAKTDANTEFFVKFLDDYFAECEEHLTSVRRNLLALEPFVNQPLAQSSLVDDLFRSFHSLKGISAMVGLAEAEQIAHQIESYLRCLRENRLILTTESLDALIAGTQTLEQVIAGHRRQAPKSDIGDLLARLERLSSVGASISPAASPRDANSATLNSAEAARVVAARDRGSKIWRFAFVPSPELAARGINVNSLRARLQEFGELIHATPRVMDKGAIAFDFVVASGADEASFAAWHEDGLTYTELDSATTPADLQSPGSSLAQQARAPSNVIRVDLARLDDLMRMVGELTISRSRLDDHLKQLESGMAAPQWRPLQETNMAMERELRALREGVMRVRMVPISEIFQRMRFVVRDLAGEHQKRIKLELVGQETELDKFLVERMMDPILHLVRNAVSHGLETPLEREAAGKDPEGTLTLRASTVAETVILDIQDDGRGIDEDEVAQRARKLGLIDVPTSENASATLDLICTPGFSTREEADRAAGRGIGMAVVKNTVLALGGSLSLDTELGRGSHFTIQLPLTLAIADALIVSVGGERFAVPQSAVLEVIEVDSSAVKAFESNEIITHREKALPLFRLARVFGLQENNLPTFHAFVIGKGLSAVGVAVDRILGQREIVVRAINDPLVRVPGIAGATELGDGHIVLILDPADLNRAAREVSLAANARGMLGRETV